MKKDRATKSEDHRLENITVPEAVAQVLAVVERLCIAYPRKKFILDGRLVGDIGKVLAKDAYALTLYSDVKKHHDG